MSDLVSRQAAIELVKDVCDAIMSGCESWYDPETEDEVYMDIREVDAILKCNKEVRIALRNMSSAQPERIRGRWTRDNACSECGCQPWFSGDIHNYNFCPNCGADMREVTE